MARRSVVRRNDQVNGWWMMTCSPAHLARSGRRPSFVRPIELPPAVTRGREFVSSTFELSFTVGYLPVPALSCDCSAFAVPLRRRLAQSFVGVIGGRGMQDLGSETVNSAVRGHFAALPIVGAHRLKRLELLLGSRLPWTQQGNA
jgi:hypothetical protein